MKRHVSAALALLIAGVALAGCVVAPYGYKRHSHWKPHHHHYHHHR